MADSWLREVWSGNFEAEMENIRSIVDDYPFVAMDTEFPGVVARPIGTFRSGSDFHYQTLKCNVDMLKLIQVGITFSDQQGKCPDGVFTWQFNFKFSLQDDMYSQESIDLLNKANIDFAKHQSDGIDPEVFGELFVSSGLALNEDVKWISFHSGYDFGYLLKIVSGLDIPSREAMFFELLKIWFPCIYDIKYLMRSCKTLKGGLQEVADDLAVERFGTRHQAGSDSQLTAASFFKMRSQFFEDAIDDSKYLGYLYGLGEAFKQFQPSTVSTAALLSKEGPEPTLPTAQPLATPDRHKIGPQFRREANNTTPSHSHAIQIKDPFAVNGISRGTDK